MNSQTGAAAPGTSHQKTRRSKRTRAPSLIRVLDWDRQDIENRMGFPSTKYTDTHAVLTFILAAFLWVSLYGGVLFVPKAPQTFIGQMLLNRGPTPFVTVFAFLWAIAILLIKNIKLKYQRQALGLTIVPRSAEFTLTALSARKVLDRMRSLVDDPKRFVLLNRIERALANLHNIGVIADVSEMLRAQGENDEDHMESSYALVRGFIWCIPILGFIGTVLGLSAAIGNFGSVLSAGEGLEQIKESLAGVTGGLSTAFDTTLLALCLALLAQLAMTGLKKKEELFLDDCKEYCHAQIVSRLRMIADTETGDEPSEVVDPYQDAEEIQPTDHAPADGKLEG